MHTQLFLIEVISKQTNKGEKKKEKKGRKLERGGEGGQERGRKQERKGRKGGKKERRKTNVHCFKGTIHISCLNRMWLKLKQIEGSVLMQIQVEIVYIKKP